MPDTQVVLGGIVFQGFEIPERINFGGAQRLVVHKMLGGNRVVDTLGSDADDIAWDGRFRGSNALQRAQAIDRIRQLGLPVTLTWGGLTRTVIVAQATFSYERSYEIPYHITCTVAQAEIPPSAPSQGIDGLIGSDLGGVTFAIADAQASVVSYFADMAAPLTEAASALGTASTGIAALNGLAGLPTSKVTGILTTLNSGQSALNGAIQIGDGNIITGAIQIATVVPSTATGMANNLTGQVAALGTLSNLLVARGQNGRAISNVGNSALQS